MCDCLDILAPPITKIVNTSLIKGEVPASWKEAIVNPILKKPDATNDFSNLRPISNLSFVSKLTEKVVHKNLHNHLTANNLYPEVQSAYRKYHSTEMALLKVHNEILLNMNKQHVTLLLLLDLSAAFDTVDHPILIEQLRQFGVKDNALSWFISYLTNRSQHVVVGDCQSRKFHVKFGVPQGSSLGPLLFIIYSSDLFKIITCHLPDVIIFADDTQIWISFKPDSELSHVSAVATLVKCVKDIKDWMDKKKLKMNDGKSEIVLIGTRQQLQKINQSPICIGSSLVTPVEAVKDLGTWLDNHMSYKIQVTKTCSVGYFHLRNIKRIRKYLSTDTTAILVHALVTSKLDYCNCLLYGLPDSLLSKLQKLQNTAARLITNKNRFCHITPVLHDLHWLPVKYRIYYKVLLITFKALHNQVPNYIKELISVKKQSSYSLRSNQAPLLSVPLGRSAKTLGDRSFAQASPTLWNSLPSYLRNIKSLGSFKSQLKTFLFKKYFYT